MTPVARDAVLEALDDVVIVLEGGRVVDVNAAADSLLGPADPVGQPAAAVFPDALTAALRADDEAPSADAESTAASSPDGSGSWLEDSPAEGEPIRQNDDNQVIELPEGGSHRCYRLRTPP